ncbi:Zinc finger matrin-type protein 2-like [Mycena indigotica]|uniref:Zinc finger matrin-type protein 2-like n=1 Tax=Mycena indigotica TaxID=2126181 RepID=A0A8H6TDQ2_9AGAR|nr:Zinc finger matrin-type protein 2-like [Mycena indigotica]KAF7315516.1 Zinc finger matrin-type protein 2-like [Mycena indigotica]
MSASNAADTDFRKKWDKEEYAERARKKDVEERERMQDNEERMRQGKRPRKGPRKEDMPKPTELMKQRDAPLELDKNLNKTMVVQNPGGKGPGQPGFFCETCSRNYKDSIGYLDHLNSRAHLRAIGQTTKLERSTLAQVQARIALLREKTKDATTAKAYDFDKRLAEVKAIELKKREDKKAAKQAEKEKIRLEMVKDSEQDDEMQRMMGFGGFGSTKK